MTEEREKAKLYLKTAKGQIEGILKMIDDGKYCVLVSNQISATASMLKKANIEILSGHIHHCVKDAIKNDNGDEKIEEIVDLLERTLK